MDKPFKRVIGSPDDLLLACKIAYGQNKAEPIIATKDLVTYMLQNEPGYAVSVCGVMVIADGYEEQYKKDLSKTMEQVNFGKN